MPDTRGPVSHIAGQPGPSARNCVLQGRKPEVDLACGRLCRVRAVHEVVLGFQPEITANGAGRGLLDGVGDTGLAGCDRLNESGYKLS